MGSGLSFWISGFELPDTGEIQVGKTWIVAILKSLKLKGRVSFGILVHDTFFVKSRQLVAELERRRQTLATISWPSTSAKPNRSVRHPMCVGAPLDHPEGHPDNWIFVGSGLQRTFPNPGWEMR
jgi:hypothetical protein